MREGNMGIKSAIKLRTRRPRPSRGQPTATGVDYEGAWSWYARNHARNFPGREHIGDEWAGTESGGATSLAEYNQLVESRFILPYVGPGDTVLELGVGGGKTAVLLRTHCSGSSARTSRPR